jgi:hypothetical protein
LEWEANQRRKGFWLVGKMWPGELAAGGVMAGCLTGSKRKKNERKQWGETVQRGKGLWKMGKIGRGLWFWERW